MNQAERELVELGREMMDFSENASMAGLKDHQIKVYNDLSEVGSMLTRFNAPWGTRAKDFTSEHMDLIDRFRSGKLVI